MDIEIPKGTLAGTPVMFCRHIGNERDGTPIWQAPEPTLWQLKLLHSREFNWFTDAHELFVTMLALHSLARRINDNECGLALEAARSVVRIACDEFYRQCTETGIWNCPLNPHDDTLAKEVLRIFTQNKNVEKHAGLLIRLRCVEMLSNPELTANHPALQITNVDPSLLDSESRAFLYVQLCREIGNPVQSMNRALDVIQFYKDAAERIKLFELERRLTATLRLHYAIFGRAS